jgi:tripartite ATP-independent transporter DctM subunit
VLFAANAFFARRHHHPGGPDEIVPAFWPAFGRALPALALPVIIMGGIVFGIVTPTEAAALTVVVALAVGAWYGGLKRGDLVESLVQTAALTGAIFMILGAVACFSWLAGHEQLPTRLAAFVTELGLGKIEYLIVVNLIFVAAGMFLDPPVALALLVPLLGPPAIALGTDPVHLGIVLCLNLTIGLITPPVGGCLLAVSTVCKVEYWALARAILPFAVLEVLLLFVIVLFPECSLFLPRWFGLIG